MNYFSITSLTPKEDIETAKSLSKCDNFIDYRTAEYPQEIVNADIHIIVPDKFYKEFKCVSDFAYQDWYVRSLNRKESLILIDNQLFQVKNMKLVDKESRTYSRYAIVEISNVNKNTVLRL